MPRVGGDKNKTHVPLELTEGIRGLGLRLGLLTGESRSAGSTGTDCFYSKEERPPNRNSHRSHRAARARGRSWKAFLPSSPAASISFPLPPPSPCPAPVLGLFRRRQWHPTPVLLPGKSHGRKGLVGCSPWGR